MNANKITSIDFSKPVEDLILPDELLLSEEDDDFSDIDDILLPDDYFDALDEPELNCKPLLRITIVGEDYVLYKAESRSEKWFGTIPKVEYRRQKLSDVRRYNYCADNSAGEAIRGRKLNTLYERYRAIEETADKAFARAFNKVYSF